MIRTSTKLRLNNILIPACLLALVTLTLVAARPAVAGFDDEDLTELRPPVPVRLKIDGKQTATSCTILKWTFGEFWVMRDRGSDPIRIEWGRLDPPAVFETVRRFIKVDDAKSFFLLGIEMLVVSEPELAERAFQQSLQYNSTFEDLVEGAVSNWLAGLDPREMITALNDLLKEQEKEAQRDRLEDSGRSPIDNSQAITGNRGWKPLSAEQRERAIKRQREFAMTAGYGPGDNERRVFETDHFVLATDLDEASMGKWGERLETMYDTLLETMGLPPSEDLYAGKCVVFIFNSRDAFLRFEDRALGYDATRAGGICHYRGEDVIQAFYRRGSEAEFQSVLVHESVHGFMYRYRSPAPLPTWASEGLADYIAGVLTPASNEPAQHWNHAKNFVRQKKSPLTIMNQSYRNGLWYTEDSYPISHMIVRFLIRYKAPEFKLWIDDIKAGRDWETSMRERFGIDAETLSRGFAAEIDSEKRFSRLP